MENATRAILQPPRQVESIYPALLCNTTTSAGSSILRNRISSGGSSDSSELESPGSPSVTNYVWDGNDTDQVRSPSRRRVMEPLLSTLMSGVYLDSCRQTVTKPMVDNCMESMARHAPLETRNRHMITL